MPVRPATYISFRTRFLIAYALLAIRVAAQDHHMGMEEMKDTTMPAAHQMHNKDSMSAMTHAYSLNLPMTRNASGTAWQPDASLMYARMIMTRKWMFMFHNNFFLRYNHQDLQGKSGRGGEKVDAPNWFMLMGQRKIHERGLFAFVAMISLDPFTVGSSGYPLLFQTGETYQGKKLVDRQHPHDLFSNLSVAYTQMLSRTTDLTLFVGYPAEPALGPVTFMHRLSSLNNPDAPLSHHWQDATHISYGVATLSLRIGIAKIESSVFNAKEPDENRYNFDRPALNSWSSRLSLSLTRQLIVQFSRAYLRSPEAGDPKDIRRATASIQHHLPFEKNDRYLSTTLIWGQNNDGRTENSWQAESNLQLDRLAIYGRYEFVQKDAHELDLPQFINGHIPVFNIQALTLGASQVLVRKYNFNLAVGAQLSGFVTPALLQSIYTKHPVSAEVYLRIYPHIIQMGSK